MTPSTLKAVRVTHHYIGVFLAPAILFFAVTGFLQTFSLHEITRGSAYVPPKVIVEMSQLHKKAEWKTDADAKRPKPDATAPAAKAAAGGAPAPVAPQPPVKKPSYHWPMKIFFGIVSLGLVTSTLTGLVMAWKYNRNKRLVALVFAAGVVLPLFLLLF